MALGSIQYRPPVTMNGYSCTDGSEVALAAQHVDPDHPRSGVDDIDAQYDPTRSEADKARIARQHAVALPAYDADGLQAASMNVVGLSVDRFA